MSSPNIIVGQVWVAESYLWPKFFFCKNGALLSPACEAVRVYGCILCVCLSVYFVCVCLFVYFVCVCLSVCVSPWESHLWPEFLLLGSAAQLSPGEREVELGRERRRQPVLRRISGEDFLLAASSSHKSHACKVSLTGESTDSLGYFLRKMFFSTFVWY